MRDFNVRVTDDAENISVYPKATNINISNDVVSVDYEDENFEHRLDEIDEIIIKSNR